MKVHWKNLILLLMLMLSISSCRRLNVKIDPEVQRYLDVSIGRTEEGILSKVKVKGKGHRSRYWDLAYILRDRKGEMLLKKTVNLDLFERKLGPEFEHFLIRTDNPEIDEVREVYVTAGSLR